MNIQVLHNTFIIHKLKQQINISMNTSYQFYSITPDEISYISDKELDDDHCISKQGGWRGLKLIGTFEFSDTNIGITAKLSGILAQAGISLCFIGTHDTDYILIQQDKLEKAIQALAGSGITILN